MNGAALMNAGKADICLNWSGKFFLHSVFPAFSQGSWFCPHVKGVCSCEGDRNAIDGHGFARCLDNSMQGYFCSLTAKAVPVIKHSAICQSMQRFQSL